MVMKLSFKRKAFNRGVLVAGAFALSLSSFALASAQFTGSPGALFGAAITAINGRPLIAITRNVNSPGGTIIPGRPQVLGTFNVYAKNVSNFATLKTIAVRVALSGNGANTMKVGNFSLIYNYCIPSGISYGYGYPGGSCGSVQLPVASERRVGNAYDVMFNQPVKVYPMQSSGVLTLSAVSVYSLATKNGKDGAQLQASVRGTGSGDQCRKIYYGYKNRYGYSKCVPQQATVTSASGNTLTVSRPYGYGYTPAPKPVPGVVPGNSGR